MVSRDDIILGRVTNPGFKPINKLDDVWVLHLSKHSKLVNHHLLVPFDILLQNDLDRHFLLVWAFGLSNNAIGSCAERSAEFISRSESVSSAQDLVDE
jgi:hypothetical protein